MVTFVYAKCTQLESRGLWEEHGNIQVNESPWLVVGDINAIRSDSERLGGNPRSLLAMSEFNGCVDICGLVEMRSQSRIISWCNGHEGSSRSWARLYRALVNINFSNTFGLTFMEYLTRKSSDHCPMMVHLSLPRSSYGPSPFHFQNMWCLHESFSKFVEDVWVQPECSHGLLRLAAKLKKLKVALKMGNRNSFGKVDLTIKALEEKMEFLDFQLQEMREPKVEAELLLTKMELVEWEAREESRWPQKAKRKWLQEGEQNSGFFHASVNQRWKATFVLSMHLADGKTLATPEEIHQGALDHFRTFLTLRLNVQQVDLIDLVQPLISEEDNRWLCDAPSVEEVREAVFSIPKHSLPGPDGFGSGFYMACWEILKDDVVEATREFFNGASLPRFYSSSYIVLIP
ncbi:hypothetical protein F2P56_022547 [Juglans regia]|uniref:Uncharacterized protein LOC109007983 n=2 Tax=Juglans regia TaxID=51240 RepID=A0A2I4GHS0_JUGRE|nr:uncharacterized protein LOC109007983 [Juglans regia]KAF5458524.1 hypothetical protein F2P56_022547 [Juglans regia]